MRSMDEIRVVSDAIERLQKVEDEDVAKDVKTVLDYLMEVETDAATLNNRIAHLKENLVNIANII